MPAQRDRDARSSVTDARHNRASPTGASGLATNRLRRAGKDGGRGLGHLFINRDRRSRTPNVREGKWARTCLPDAAWAAAGPAPGKRVCHEPVIKGDMGRQRPDLFQIFLGIWVVIGLLLLVVVVARSLP